MVILLRVLSCWETREGNREPLLNEITSRRLTHNQHVSVCSQMAALLLAVGDNSHAHKKHRIECRETHVRLLFAWMLAEKLKHWSQFFWHYVYFCFFYSSTCMHNSCRSKQYTVLVFMPLGQLFKEWKSEMVFWWCYCTCVCTYRLGVVSSTDVKTGLYKEQTFPQIQYWSGWVSDSAFN